jgi:hypothetical protein
MKKRLLIIIGSLLFTHGCGGQREALYQNVRSNDKWQEKTSVVRRFDINQPIPKYIIVENEMFLNVQNTRQRMFYTEVDHPAWDQNAVASMKAGDAVFASHLPRNTDPAGGVGWIAAKAR